MEAGRWSFRDVLEYPGRREGSTGPKATPMGVNGEGGDVTALGRSERLSLTGARVHLGEEESEASTGMAKNGNKGLGATMYSHFGTARPGGMVSAVDGVGNIVQML